MTPDCDPPLALITYTWYCVLGDGTPCDDTQSLFGITRTDDVLVIPSTYFTSSNQYNISLEVSYFDEAADAFVLITDSSVPPEDIVFEINCIGCSFGYYSPNYPQVFTISASNGAVLDSGLLSPSWSFTPNLDSLAEGDNQMSVGTQSSFDLGTSLTITVNAANGTHVGQGSATFPINQVPIIDSFSVTPTEGLANDTLFTFSIEASDDQEDFVY